MLLRGSSKKLTRRVANELRSPSSCSSSNLRPLLCRTTIFGTVLAKSSSSSSKRWQNRHAKDKFTKEARVQGLMSRAAFKLLEINEKYKIFKRGQTVVDLGYAPGSWSQVAVDRTLPGGRVIGIDVIPAQPPKGVSTIQGNFLSKAVREQVKQFVRDPTSGQLKEGVLVAEEAIHWPLSRAAPQQITLGDHDIKTLNPDESQGAIQGSSLASDFEGMDGRVEIHEMAVDVVLSDMSAPWEQTTGFKKRSLSDPYYRMMNTSGITFKDHAGSMDLCNAALEFSFDTLRTGGSFVCKFYQGGEDKALELRLKKLFTKVHREKPESSRSESKESYFVGLLRKVDVRREDILVQS